MYSEYYGSSWDTVAENVHPLSYHYTNDNGYLLNDYDWYVMHILLYYNKCILIFILGVNLVQTGILVILADLTSLKCTIVSLILLELLPVSLCIHTMYKYSYNVCVSTSPCIDHGHLCMYIKLQGGYMYFIECQLQRWDDTHFGCIDISPPFYHDTAIYCMIQYS